MTNATRTEHDSMGPVELPADALYGAAFATWNEANNMAAMEQMRANQAQQQCISSYFTVCDPTATAPDLETMQPIVQRAVQQLNRAIAAHPSDARARTAMHYVIQGLVVVGDADRLVDAMNAFLTRYPMGQDSDEVRAMLVFLQMNGLETGVSDTGGAGY